MSGRARPPRGGCARRTRLHPTRLRQSLAAPPTGRWPGIFCDPVAMTRPIWSHRGWEGRTVLTTACASLARLPARTPARCGPPRPSRAQPLDRPPPPARRTRGTPPSNRIWRNRPDRVTWTWARRPRPMRSEEIPARCGRSYSWRWRAAWRWPCVGLRTAADDRPGRPEPAAAPVEARFRETVRPFLETHCLRLPRQGQAQGRPGPERLHDRRVGGEGPPALGAGPGAARGRLDAPGEGEAAADGRGPRGGDRLDRRGPQARGDAERGRPGPGPRAAAEQRRIRQHDPRPDGRGPAADEGVPRRPGQRGGLRQLGRVAGDVAGPGQEVPGGRPAASPTTSCSSPTAWPSRRTRCSPTPTATSTASRPIIDFYKRQKTDYADYFLAAWRFRHRAALGQPDATLDGFADERGLSRKYLATIWSTLDGTAGGGRPDRRAPGDVARAAGPRRRASRTRRGPAASGCGTSSSSCGRQLVPEVKNLTARGISDGTQPFVLWKNRQLAANRMRYAGGAAKIRTDELAPGGRGGPGARSPRRPGRRRAVRGDVRALLPDVPRRLLRLGAGPDLPRPEGGQGERRPPAQRRVPQHDRLLPRRRPALRADARRGRAAGARPPLAGVRLHHRRPDAAVLELPLVRAGRDRLPAGRRGVRLRPRRGQGRRLRGQDGAVRRRSTWRRPGGSGRATRRSAPSRTSSGSSPRPSAASSRTAARPSPATSRPSSGSPSGPIAGRSRTDERQGVADFYRTLRDEDGLSHEDAVRDTVVGILMSPHFCYRVDLPGGGGARPAAVGLRPGQPPELFPLGEHARRGAALARRGGRPAPARGAGGPGPADAPRRPRARPGRRSSAATGSTSAGSRSTTASTAAGSPRSTTSCGGRCSRSRSGSSWTSSGTTAR